MVCRWTGLSGDSYSSCPGICPGYANPTGYHLCSDSGCLESQWIKYATRLEGIGYLVAVQSGAHRTRGSSRNWRI